jgi:FkbM family methyltransferase
MSIIRGMQSYYSTFGMSAVWAVASHRLTGWPKYLKARPTGIRFPIWLRIKTTDPMAYSSILLGKEYDFDLPFSPRTILDAGANIGMASIYYSQRYPLAKIIAVEPEASNFAVLLKNVAPYPNITPIQAALWNRDGFISLRSPDPSTGAFGEWGFITDDGNGSKVRAVTIPTLMAENKLDSIDLLKIDIEGAEREVFSDCGWLDHVKSLAIETHDRFKSGCSASVGSGTRDFSKFEHGETTFYIRHGI